MSDRFYKEKVGKELQQILTSAPDYKKRKGVGHHEIYHYRKKY